MYMAGFVLQIRVKTKCSCDKSEASLSKTWKVSCDAQRGCSEHHGGEVTAESGAGVDTGPASHHRRWCREDISHESRWSTFSI